MKTNFIICAILFLLNISAVYSGPTNLSSDEDPHNLDIVLVGTNDIHGTAYPIVLARKDTGQTYNYGGLVYMARIIEIIKKQNNGNVLYLDAGDQFQGGLESSKIISSGQIISDYFNHLIIQGGAVGNHQFDFGPDFLDSYLDKLNHDILNANLIDTSKQQLPLKDQKRSKIYTFPIKNKPSFLAQNFTDIKIGVIGLSTIQTPYTTSGFIENLFPVTYKFEDYKEIVIQEAESLKAQGAHALIIVSHAGNGCNNESEYGLWTIQNQRKQIPCQPHDELFRLIDELPQGTINAVVQGHRHTQSHYFYKGIPIIGTTNGGYYLNTIRLRFTLNETSAHLKPQDLLIQGPIPVCQKVFEGTKKCEYVSFQNLQKAGKLIQWTFHNQKIFADPQLSQIYHTKYSEKMKIYEYEIVKNYISEPLIKDYLPNSAIGNLMTNVIAHSVERRGDLQIDFVILNGGGFRTTWYPGVIRYAQLHSMLPFDNEVFSFKIRGKDLKKLLQIVQNGAKRYYPTWGLQQRYRLNPGKYLQLEKIRHKHLLSQQQLRQSQTYFELSELRSTLTGEPIKDDQVYTGVTVGFLLNGGDDFNQIVNKPDQINIFDKKVYPIMLKDLVQIELERRAQLTDDDLIGPNNMQRIIFESYHRKKD